MSNGGEVFISKIDAFKITDLALALNPDIVFKHIGIRPGEKIHELLIAEGEARTSYEYENHFVVYPEFKWNEGQNFVHAGGKQVKEDFIYSSGQTNLLSVEQLKECLTQLEKRGGSF
jgi:FlaA1/EpsC-like NDP-sugar epimerase